MFILNLAFADLLYCVTNIPMYSILVRGHSLINNILEIFDSVFFFETIQLTPLQFFYRGWPWSDTTCRMFAVAK